MGIPSPIWSWSNDVIAIKRKLNIPIAEFDKAINELALKLFKKGYDIRFQTTQAIPVFINEMINAPLFAGEMRLYVFPNPVRNIVSSMCVHSSSRHA